jgi:hypothetical protein
MIRGIEQIVFLAVVEFIFKGQRGLGVKIADFS